jgi:DNA-binding transcriptional regulator WhiA
MTSADTKDALTRDVPAASHCREALLAGLALYGSARGAFVTHRNAVARLFWSLLDERKSFPIETRAPTRLQRLPTFAIELPERLRATPPKPVHKCDRLIEVRAAFLACGSLAGGARGYHLEFVTRGEEIAQRLKWMLRSAGVPPKLTRRKTRVVLYYKDFDAIVELLTHVGAFGAVLALDTAQAAATQRSIIEYVRNAHGLARLTPALREVAELRLKYPDESLAELGRRCNPPIAKPTVSSRLGALVRLADHLRGGQVSVKAVR